MLSSSKDLISLTFFPVCELIWLEVKENNQKMNTPNYKLGSSAFRNDMSYFFILRC